MAGTLLISREVKNHLHFKKKIEALGFLNVTVTALEKDALGNLIRSMKPDTLLMSARFYQCSTPHMMGMLKKEFPKLYMAALSIGEYPADLGMYFILNGVNAYATTFDGLDEWYIGLEEIRKHKNYESPAVTERKEMRKDYPLFPAGGLTKQQIEILRCTCNGLTRVQIADLLSISEKTVGNHKVDIYRTLNVTNGEELFRAALRVGIVTAEELVFCHPAFACAPIPEKMRNEKREIKNEIAA